MNKDGKIILLAAFFCFLIVSIAIQLTFNEGYMESELLPTGDRIGTVHKDYSIGVRLIPVLLVGIILAMVLFSVSNSEDSLVARFDKRLFGEK